MQKIEQLEQNTYSTVFIVMEINTEKFRKTECPKCGDTHTCCLGMHCWCAPIEIPDELSDMQNLMYNECLCKSCLTEEIKDFHKAEN